MALNHIEREVLKAARELIRQGKSSHVCYAIDRANTLRMGASLDRIRDAKFRLRAYVMQQLEGSTSLGFYIAKKYHCTFPGDWFMRNARIAWITWMLGEEVVLDGRMQREFTECLRTKGTMPWHLI